jgi:hypothetical protein
MVGQYPHNLKVTIPGQGREDEATGNYIPGTPTIFEASCRAELNTEAKVIRGEDGNDVAYSFTVYTRKTDVVFPYNSEVEITMGANRTVKGTVKGQSNGQLNTRIWV